MDKKNITPAEGYRSDSLTTDNLTDLKTLYNQYADKLLGYIMPIINDRTLAEECVVKIFTDISSSNNLSQLNTGYSTWSRLMALANQQLEALGKTTTECKSVINNTAYIQSHKYLNKMTETQRLVFCGVYYHRKSTATLATELSLSEQDLRLRLKEAFMIIRGVKDEN